MKPIQARSSTAATTTLAMLAVAQHAADYGLDVHGINAPIADDSIGVSVPAAQLDAWLDTIVVDEDPVVRSATSAPYYETVTYRGHLAAPIGDISITISTARRVTPLHLVGSAS